MVKDESKEVVEESPEEDADTPANAPEPPPAKKKPARKSKADKQKARETTLTQELEQTRDRLLRMTADFDNFRKRTLREKGELYARATEDVMEELLPVLDHLELAIKAAAEHDAGDAFLEGFRLVSEQLKTALTKHGLECIDPEEGTAFDPNEHEAISHLPSESVGEDAVMVNVRKGYRLGGRLLRAAQVVVSSGSPAETPEPTGKDA